MSRMLLVTLLLLVASNPSWAEPQASKQAEEKLKEIAGTAEYLRSLPKHYARLVAVDPRKHQVTLLIEGEKEEKIWSLTPDAEVRVSGWWGRLDQLTLGDRHWVWLQKNREGQPVAITMLADELSEQDLHGDGVKVIKADESELVTRAGRAPERKLKASLKDQELAAGSMVYVQSCEGTARLVLTPQEFQKRRARQQKALRERWLSKGLPGIVSVLHRFSGEMELLLDHEAMRWARALKPGDKVTILTSREGEDSAKKPIVGAVKHVRPWREKSQVRLVVRGADQTDLAPGLRVQAILPAPSAEIEQAVFPPDVDQARAEEERIEWIMASIYCTCMVRGDGCTGHYYTLASCNPNACGMPRAMRRRLNEMIVKGLTDRQILQSLLDKEGPMLLRPHILR